MTPRDAIAAVQHSALERALIDGDDARRYFALAGALETIEPEQPSDTVDASSPSSSGADEGDRSAGVLPAAMLSLAVVPHLTDSGPSPAMPATIGPRTTDPWTVGGDTTHPAVRRGARLAVRWFDVSPEQVASRAGLPEADLIAPVE